MPNGYLQVHLYRNSVRCHYYVHRLVAQAFPDLVGWTEDAKGRPFEELEINHKDKDKENNRVENLEWCSRSYNVKYSADKLSKKVYMYTLDDKLCGMWPSIMECGRCGFDFSHVAKCCRGELKKHKGFKWSYEPQKPLLALPYYPLAIQPTWLDFCLD